MTKTEVRRLFKAGASVRAVMFDAGVKQREVADLAGVQQCRVTMVLAGGRHLGTTAKGRETAARVHAAIAKLLGVSVRIVEAANTHTEK